MSYRNKDLMRTDRSFVIKSGQIWGEIYDQAERLFPFIFSQFATPDVQRVLPMLSNASDETLRSTHYDRIIYVVSGQMPEVPYNWRPYALGVDISPEYDITVMTKPIEPQMYGGFNYIVRVGLPTRELNQLDRDYLKALGWRVLGEQ
jgi:hypothetical protein